MNVLRNITRNISGNWSKYAAKGVGLATLGLVGYDAHCVAKLQGDMYATEKDVYSACSYLNNTLYNPGMSTVAQKVKNGAFGMEVDQTWRRFFNLGIGYVKGFTSMLTNHVVPFALGLGALLTKGTASKICAGTAVLYGLGKAIVNFFGIGVPRGPLE